MDDDTVTNRDLYERMQKLEVKMDSMTRMMEQMTGAWTLVKIMASVAVGAAVFWNTVVNFFKP